MINDRQSRHSFVQDGVTVGFLTDPTLCIGCKACEVACKEWNDVPPGDGLHELGDSSNGRLSGGFGASSRGGFANSYDNTGDLGANTWRHVKFVETESEEGLPRWLFLSDVCKHCSNAGCLNACPTGAIWRTEVGSVLVDDDRCNGCGYCVVSCPFGVIDRRGRPSPELMAAFGQGGAEHEAIRLGRRNQTQIDQKHFDQSQGGSSGEGGAFKCTLCYDRQTEGKIPACAHACPTDSILFGPLAELQQYGQERLVTLAERGVNDAVLYDGSVVSAGEKRATGENFGGQAAGSNVGGTHALSILLGASVDDVAPLWGQPRTPVVPSAYMLSAWGSALVTGLVLALSCWLSFSL